MFDFHDAATQIPRSFPVKKVLCVNLAALTLSRATLEGRPPHVPVIFPVSTPCESLLCQVSRSGIRSPCMRNTSVFRMGNLLPCGVHKETTTAFPYSVETTHSERVNRWSLSPCIPTR